MNGDGKIEEEEFVKAYQKVYPQMDPVQVAKDAREFFAAADVDKNGSIDFGEWSAATINKRNLFNE
jgi:Ca2+-binding EF-hand superfamily protein